MGPRNWAFHWAIHLLAATILLGLGGCGGVLRPSTWAYKSATDDPVPLAVTGPVMVDVESQRPEINGYFIHIGRVRIRIDRLIGPLRPRFQERMRSVIGGKYPNLGPTFNRHVAENQTVVDREYATSGSVKLDCAVRRTVATDFREE